MNRPNSVALTLTFLLLAALVTVVVAQDVRPERPTVIGTAPVVPPAGYLNQAATTYSSFPQVQGVPGFFRYGNMNSPEAKAVAQALQKLKSAESDDDKTAAKAELKTALAAQYDANLISYEEQLNKMEQKLQELREQLKRRRSAKSEIVELHLQLKVNEAEGLGWPSGSFNSRLLMPGSQNPYSVAPSPLRTAPTATSGRTR